MNLEKKLEFAKEVYSKLDLNEEIFKSSRDDEINADYVWIPNTKGLGGLIIGDDGSFLFCQSARGFDYWKEEYKKGIRSNKD